MDYSLLVGVDKEQQELVVGVIDYIRQVRYCRCSAGYGTYRQHRWYLQYKIATHGCAVAGMQRAWLGWTRSVSGGG